MGRDESLDQAIEELGKEQQSLLDTLEGLGSILLEAHSQKTDSAKKQLDTSIEDVEVEFGQAIEAIDAYIKEREEYWEKQEADPEEMLEEELERLQQEEEQLKETLKGLTSVLEGAWKDVMSEWGGALEEWEDMLKDLLEIEE